MRLQWPIPRIHHAGCHRLVPNPFIAKPFPFTPHQRTREGLPRKENAYSVWLKNVRDASPHRRKWNDRIPCTFRRAIRRIDADHRHTLFRKSRHHSKTVSVIEVNGWVVHRRLVCLVLTRIIILVSTSSYSTADSSVCQTAFSATKRIYLGVLARRVVSRQKPHSQKVEASSCAITSTN